MNDDERFRLRILAGMVLLVGALFVVRLYFLQIVHGDAYQKEAEKQYVATLPHLYNRGTIYFKDKLDKLVAGATVGTGYVVAITPRLITNKEETYRMLNATYPLNKEEFMQKASREDDPYEEIMQRVPEKEAKAIKSYDIDGVKIYRQTWRVYPSDETAAQTIGFVGYRTDGTTLAGRYGIERYYDDVLARKEEDLYVNFFAELFSNLKETLFDRDTAIEGDVVLSIEPNVQGYLEQELTEVMKEWHSDQTGGIIIEPSTGRILAMATNPTFNLNEYNKVTNQRVFGNPMVESVFEMGSIMKPLTVAAGLDAGVITANSTYNDTGTITLNKKTISNYDGKGRGPGTTMQTVLNNSLNTGVAYIVSRLGNEKFSQYMLERYKIGEETGIDLPGEVQGLIGNLASKRDVEYATASFGQGIAITPINMVQSLSILANGGYVTTPHVVDEIRYTNGEIRTITPNPPEQVLKRETSEEISRMLVHVVDHALLNGKAKVPEYSIAAKTGTAQVARPRELGGGYYEDRYLHTFFGYFPAYDPKFLVFFYTYYPKNAEYASHTLTYPFIRTAKFLLNYYNVPPDRDSEGKRLPVTPPQS